jgi:hypothetical protein
MYHSKPCIARIVGSATLLAIAVAGCGGSANSAFATVPGVTPSQLRGANVPAQSTQKLYVANSGGGVLVYSIGSSPTLLQTITNGVPSPGGLWIDSREILYAVNVTDGSLQSSLAEYKPGANAPFRTITNGILNCPNVAADKHENVYVACADNSTKSFFLEIYPKGQLSPAQTVTIPRPSNSRISGLAFDSTGALLVGVSIYFQQGAVYRLAPGSQNFTNLNLQDATGGTIAVDKAGNLYVGSGSSAGDQVISIYPPNATSPSRQITVQNILDALAVEPNGQLYVETIGAGPPQISVYAPGSDAPKQTFDVAGGGGGIALRR